MLEVILAMRSSVFGEKSLISQCGSKCCVVFMNLKKFLLDPPPKKKTSTIFAFLVIFTICLVVFQIRASSNPALTFGLYVFITSTKEDKQRKPNSVTVSGRTQSTNTLPNTGGISLHFRLYLDLKLTASQDIKPGIHWVLHLKKWSTQAWRICIFDSHTPRNSYNKATHIMYEEVFAGVWPGSTVCVTLTDGTKDKVKNGRHQLMSTPPRETVTDYLVTVSQVEQKSEVKEMWLKETKLWGRWLKRAPGWTLGN